MAAVFPRGKDLKTRSRARVSSSTRRGQCLVCFSPAARTWAPHRRGFVVNINHIGEVVPWFKSSYQLRMNDKKQTEIPVSRSQTRRLRELFNL